VAIALKSTSYKYGAVAVPIHWLSAALILILIVSGFRAAGAVGPEAKAAILRVHLPIAIGMLALTLLRVVGWLGVDRTPDPVGRALSWQERIARVVHALFYVVILGTVASGIGMIVLSGAASVMFSGEYAALPDFWKYPPRLPHAAGARLLIALVVLHFGAAVYHHFVRRDDLFWRMWFGGRAADHSVEKGVIS
jgi:cytochrome b561